MKTTVEEKASNTTSLKLGNRKQALSELARYQKRTVHSLLLEAVDMYIEQKQARMKYEQDAIRSYEHFKETGLHITLDEMEQWAKSLNISNPHPLPQCHT